MRLLDSAMSNIALTFVLTSLLAPKATAGVQVPSRLLNRRARLLDALRQKKKRMPRRGQPRPPRPRFERQQAISLLAEVSERLQLIRRRSASSIKARGSQALRVCVVFWREPFAAEPQAVFQPAPAMLALDPGLLSAGRARRPEEKVQQDQGDHRYCFVVRLFDASKKDLRGLL